MPDSSIDAEKLGVLRRWGSGLQADPRGEVAAAGRAIIMLVDEIERLHVLVWDRRLYPDEPPPPAPSGESVPADPDERPSHGFTHALLQRLRRAPAPVGASPQAEAAPEEPFHT